MKVNGLIETFPKELKLLIAAFVVVLSVGFYTGLLFVNETASTDPDGIEQQYLGNEHDEEAEVMKFKKTEQAMLTLVHGHILSMSIIFFLVGLILVTTRLNYKFKMFLLIEPFISVVLTFGGLYLLWSGMLWVKYIVMISGFFMTLCYTLAVIIILKQLVSSSIKTKSAI
ncbi:hypothetical protein DFQ11_106127 [Winogradskyella epiphytica]|uniref:Uncharacterized protein n=1 Tax=Winogradskyella epiphytica TaxID=262005 RepID=A0A2V4WV35_9FLAO|nr:hypothetical protein [Winogradskyella epiphytica]PYE80327.1 hypothetical protein DFQ11_106127 [Winogradskyella epiphytica]GGW70588.1 hypothetical protein GCM10008085_23290 [Winogradskyella epiphytica]